MDSSYTWFHKTSFENILGALKGQLRLEGQQLGGSSDVESPTKKSPRLLIWDWMDKANTKLPHECKSLFHFYAVFHDKLLKSAAERVKAAAIMCRHVKIIPDRATSHLAYNKDIFCPLVPFKSSSVCASWWLCWWTWGMWWKNLSLVPISRETDETTQRWAPCTTEIARYVFSESDGHLSPLSGCHRWLWRAVSCSQLFIYTLMCFSCHNEM